MAALPYMQFYPADYLADTMHLTTEEHGAYLLLLMNYWQTGKPLMNDDRRLANIARVPNDRWTDVKRTLIEFFVLDGDVLKQPRMEADLEAIRQKQEQAAAAGKASAKARKQRLEMKNKHKGNGMPTDVETDVATRAQRESNHIDPDPDPDSRSHIKSESSASASMKSKNTSAIDEEIFHEVISYFNQINRTKFKKTAKYYRLLSDLFDEGQTIDEIKAVIRMKNYEWREHDFMFKYLRPGTIFKSSNFNNYVGHVPEFIAREREQVNQCYQA